MIDDTKEAFGKNVSFLISLPVIVIEISRNEATIRKAAKGVVKFRA